MITQTKGDLLQADEQALVNTVNCVGVMGAGIALQFKKAFEKNYKEYRQKCDAGEVKIGEMFIHEIEDIFNSNPQYIVNFPTKRHWKDGSHIEDIESGLESLVENIRRLEIKSIAMPALGCGLGGLDWDDVLPKIEAAFKDMTDVYVKLFPPQDHLLKEENQEPLQISD